jgi:hypothetical protein
MNPKSESLIIRNSVAGKENPLRQMQRNFIAKPWDHDTVRIPFANQIMNSVQTLNKIQCKQKHSQKVNVEKGTERENCIKYSEREMNFGKIKQELIVCWQTAEIE